MYQQIVLYANLSGFNQHNRKSLELHSLLEEFTRYKTVLNPDHREIENSLVIISGFNLAFRDLHISNRVFYLSRTGILNHKEISLLPRIDVLVANSQLEAANLAWQVRNYGFKTKIVYLPPYCKLIDNNSTIESTISYAHLDNKYRLALAGFNLVKATKVQPSAFANVHLTDSPAGWPYLILESMVAGIPPIIKITNPASEYITHGFNGYVVADVQDVVWAITDLKKRRKEISDNCKLFTKALFDPQRYAEFFIDDNKNRNLNIFGPIKIEHQNRRWIIREKTLRDDDTVYFPDTYDPSLQTIDLVEITEILEYFSVQLFSDVYVFGCEFPEWYGPAEMTKINALVTKLGDRAKRIHFCRDELISHHWAPAFKKLSLVSVDEGLKQISN